MLQKIKTVSDLSRYLGISQKRLLHLEPKEYFHTFQIPKLGSTEKRIIETPTGPLKEILFRLSDGLQVLYHDYKTDAAFGFIRATNHDSDVRNILTNARCHLSKNYLVNVDFDNFFYQVNREKVQNIFNNYQIFSFFPETESVLTNLVLYNERLPMGSPTSPALSNFATIDLDNELLLYSRKNYLVYTRYVDDLTFSSEKPITEKHFDQLATIFQSHRFSIDPLKTKWYGKDDAKEITGLIVGKSIAIPERYLDDFENELIKLQEVIYYSRQYPDGHVLEWLEKLERIMNGRLAFIKMIYGKRHPVYLRLHRRMESIVKTNVKEESVSWRYAGYEYF